MNIHWTKFNNYIYELQQAKNRVKRDKKIIKIISKMNHIKSLPESKENELIKLLETAYLGEKK